MFHVAEPPSRWATNPQTKSAVYAMTKYSDTLIREEERGEAMTSMVMILRSDGPGCYLMDHGGRRVLPVFDNQRDAKTFMEGRRIDGERYYAGPAMTYGHVEDVAREIEDQGVQYWSFGPPSAPGGLVMRIPIDDLIGQARKMPGKHP
jgi:hypothetical protein